MNYESLSALEDLYSYGVEWDEMVSSPTLTRVGNSSLHRTLPIQSEMKAYTLTAAGVATLVDWSNPTVDGSAGQVMTKIPEHFERCYWSGSKKGIRWSTEELPGYRHIPEMYIGTYQGSMDRTNNKLMSIVNSAAQYRGGSNSATLQGYDGTYRSLLGRPSSEITRTNYRTYARANGNEHWNMLTNLAWKQLFWAFVIEYATFNSQLDFNATLTADGYHQGGLSAGVSEWTQTAWSSFYGGDGSSMRYPFVPCGHTDSLGNNSGVVNYQVKDASDNVIHTAKANRYRGIEMPFGHIWMWIDGINIQVNPTSDDNLSHIFVCDTPSLFQDSSYEGYKEIGTLARGNNYGKTLVFGEEGDILYKSQQSGSTSYLCDYLYNIIPTATQLRGLYVGGSATCGAYCGLSCAFANHVPSYSSADFGSRLCYHV